MVSMQWLPDTPLWWFACSVLVRYAAKCAVECYDHVSGGGYPCGVLELIYSYLHWLK